jgi:hypothetical protein
MNRKMNGASQPTIISVNVAGYKNVFILSLIKITRGIVRKQELSRG